MFNSCSYLLPLKVNFLSLQISTRRKASTRLAMRSLSSSLIHDFLKTMRKSWNEEISFRGRHKYHVFSCFSIDRENIFINDIFLFNEVQELDNKLNRIFSLKHGSMLVPQLIGIHEEHLEYMRNIKEQETYHNFYENQYFKIEWSFQGYLLHSNPRCN